MRDDTEDAWRKEMQSLLTHQSTHHAPDLFKVLSKLLLVSINLIKLNLRRSVLLKFWKLLVLELEIFNYHVCKYDFAMKLFLFRM